MLARVVDSGVTLEVCPVSNVSLGVYSTLEEVPVPTLLEAGIPVALGADDPLLFGSRLASQYAVVRAAHDLSDAQLAELARMSVRASYAPDDLRARPARADRRLARRGCDRGRVSEVTGSPPPATPSPPRPGSRGTRLCPVEPGVVPRNDAGEPRVLRGKLRREGVRGEGAGDGAAAGQRVQPTVTGSLTS